MAVAAWIAFTHRNRSWPARPIAINSGRYYGRDHGLQGQGEVPRAVPRLLVEARAERPGPLCGATAGLRPQHVGPPPSFLQAFPVDTDLVDIQLGHGPDGLEGLFVTLVEVLLLPRNLSRKQDCPALKIGGVLDVQHDPIITKWVEDTTCQISKGIA